MKASELIKEIVNLCEHHNVSPNDINVNLRENYDTEVCDINHVFEDLYDEKTNKILTDIVLMEDDRELNTPFMMSKEEFCYADLRTELINQGLDDSVEHVESQYANYKQSVKGEL